MSKPKRKLDLSRTLSESAEEQFEASKKAGLIVFPQFLETLQPEDVVILKRIFQSSLLFCKPKTRDRWAELTNISRIGSQITEGVSTFGIFVKPLTRSQREDLEGFCRYLQQSSISEDPDKLLREWKNQTDNYLFAIWS